MKIAWERPTEIYLPELIIDSIKVVPNLLLGLNIDKINNQFGYVLSPIEAQSYNPPALSELVHAYFGKDNDGENICPEYRRVAYEERETGEWTSTFVLQGRSSHSLTLVNRPKRFFF